MDARTKKIDDADRKKDSAGERRRLSRVRHDDRGNAYVEWVDAPADLIERPKFEIQGDTGGLQLESERCTYDPYSNGSGGGRKSGSTSRTDLRKLSEWIKMMRELEERKRNGGNGEE